MKTANIGNIAISTPITKKSRFNLNHDNNTTYDWGSIQPTLCKMMLPDSSINIKAELLTRVAPLVVPTFGRIKIKNYAHFIKMSEIWPNWDAMISQTKVTRSGINAAGSPAANTYIPKYVPYISSDILSAMCLIGARVNLYFSGKVGTSGENRWHCARNTGTYTTPAGWPTATLATREYLAKILGIQNSATPTIGTVSALKYTGYTMTVRKLCNRNQGGDPYCSITGNGTSLFIPTISTMIPQEMPNSGHQGYTHSAANEDNMNVGADQEPAIEFDGGDMIWEYDGVAHQGITAAERTGTGNILSGITSSEFDDTKIRLVFKLSSFGKRLRKTLIGLGYDVNLANYDDVSLLPLFAEYKAYWDSFAPERTKNFYETACWKLINACMSTTGAADVRGWLNTAGTNSVAAYFMEFIGDLGTCFATEKIDAISAATDEYYANTNTTVDANGQSEIQKVIISTLQTVLWNPQENVGGTIINADGSTNTNQAGTSNNTQTNSILNGITQYLYGAAQQLTQPQLDALKKGYIMLNKSSVAGMAVEDILRALGQGDFVEECKGKFITVQDDAIKISDVVATAATQEAKLGQYGGRGLGLTEFKCSYSTNAHGYLIILSCIVPESGYINSPAHENEAITFEKMYQPELDGLAYEAIQKKAIAGSPLINDPTYSDTFGFLPTYSQWKFMSNKANGDFSLNSRKKYMTPFTLDKYIPIADTNSYKTEIDQNTHPGTTMIYCAPTFRYEDCPNAGEDYRYINKFPWNGEYNRIFDAEDDGLEWSVFSPNNNAFLYNSFEYDNFMVHHVFEIEYWAHMKPIEQSYGTYDEEHEAPNTSIKKS